MTPPFTPLVPPLFPPAAQADAAAPRPVLLQRDGDAVRTFDVELLAERARTLLLRRCCVSLTTSEAAQALGVPFWVADVVLDELGASGDARFDGSVWRAGCSATMALQASFPAALVRAGRRT